MSQYVPDLGQAYVRVTGERLGKFVEFEFSLNDEYLTIELILPYREFHDFCARHRAILLEPGDAPIDSRPGLYQRSLVDDASDESPADGNHQP